MRILEYNDQCAIRGAIIQFNNSVKYKCICASENSQSNRSCTRPLKRRLQYDHNLMPETIRPVKIYVAVRYLINTEHCKKCNIVLSSEWLNSMNCTAKRPLVSNVEDLEMVSRLTNTNILQDYVEEVNPQETVLDN